MEIVTSGKLSWPIQTLFFRSVAPLPDQRPNWTSLHSSCSSLF